MITETEINLILNGIRSNSSFRLEFGKAADSILDKIFSYYSNPNCTCKSTIKDWIIKNENKSLELINRFKDSLKEPVQQILIESKKEEPEKPIQQPSNIPNLKIGEVFFIERTEEAYKNFHTKMKDERWAFRGLSVTPHIHEGKEVWAIFTY